MHIPNKPLPIVLIFSLLLGGCASSVDMATADRKNIQTITVDPSVPKGPIRVVTMGQALTMGISGVLGGAVGGGIAGAVQGSTPNGPAEQLQAIMDKNNIKVEVLVRDEFARQAGERHLFKVVDAKGDGQATLIVPTWGFMVPSPYQWALRPTAMVMVVMKDPAGRVVWKDTENSSHLNFSVPKQTLEEYAAKPELRRDGLGKAVAAAVGKLMDNYAKQGPETRDGAAH